MFAVAPDFQRLLSRTDRSTELRNIGQFSLLVILILSLCEEVIASLSVFRLERDARIVSCGVVRRHLLGLLVLRRELSLSLTFKDVSNALIVVLNRF